MAYKLTYYKVIDNIRINFYEKDGVKATQEIGPVVQGLNLEIQGQQSDATAPIVKTSLNMVFCDAPDLDPEKKCGNWAEFYTPDATKWKVEVVTINEDGSADIEWSGFITPDSYMEELTYRGSVNIIARDNIGQLQNIDFTEEGDEVGMMTVKEILRTAWAKIEQPMMLTFDDYEDILWLQSEGIKAYDASINVSAFAGKTWNDVVEAVLDSFGLCMRYVGLNEVAVTPIRYLSLAGTVASSSTRRIIPTFEAGATRELTPACKMIIETSDYESASVSAKPITAEDFLGTEGEYPFLEDGENSPVLAPVMPISNQSGEGWSNNPSATLFFNPYAREIGSLSQRKRLTNEIRRYMYIAANNSDFSRFVTYRRAVRAMPSNIKLSLAEPITLEDNKIERTDGVMFTHLIYSLAFVQNGITSYYKGNGAWSSSHNVLSTQNTEDTLSIPVAFNRIAGGGTLELNIIAIVYASKSGVPGVGLYASVQAVEFVSSSPTLSKNIVKTIYDERNNVIVDKSPILAPALDEVLLPGFIKNGIFVKSDGIYYPAKTWSWNGNGEQQLAVYKHLQYLTFTSKPNNLISGKIIGVPLSKIRSIWMFEGNEHLLISGRFNFLTNNIDNAILHEFTRYEDMWGDITDSATLPQVVTTEETTSASSGARSDAGNVNSTTVYIGSQGGGGSSTLAGLEDVNIEDILPSSLLVFNGSKWVDVPVASLFSNVNTKVANLETKVNPIDTWFNEVGKFFKKDSDGVWYVDGSFYTKGQNAAGAVGSPDGGGSSGSGVMLLESWSDVPSDLSGYALSAALGIDLHERFNNFYTIGDVDSRFSGISSRLATLDSGMADRYTKAESDGRYLKLSGGVIRGAGAELLHIARTDGNPYVTFYADGSFLGRLGFSTNGEPIAIVNTQLVSLIHSGNVGEYALKNKGATEVAESELPVLNTFGLWHTIGPYIRFGISEAYNITIRSSSNKLQALVNASKDGDWKTIAFTDSDISGNAASATRSRYIETQNYTGAGWYGDSYKLYAKWYNATICDWKSTDDVNNEYKVRVDIAKKLDTARTLWGQSFDGTGNVSGDITMNNYSAIKFKNAAGTSALNEMMVDGNNYLTIGYDQAANSLPTRIDGSSVYLRYGTAHANGLILNQYGNVTIGATDKLTNSATTKLYVDGGVRFAPRTIWGQSFDGTGNVSGSIKHTNGWSFIDPSDGNVIFGYDYAHNNKPIYIDGKEIYLRYGTGHTTGLILNSSGNVTIGGSDIAEVNYKLATDGKIYIRSPYRKDYPSLGSLSSNSDFCIEYSYSYGVYYGLNAETGNGFVQVGLNNSSKITYNYLIQPLGGNVGIGTTSPAYKLDVAGSIRTTSSLTIGSIVLTDENGTLKIQGNAYTTGQLGAGEAGQPTSGGGNVILDYDSIVDALGFTPAKQNDLSSLTSRVLALENAGPSSSSSSLYGDEITIGSSMGNIYISSENDVQIDSLMGSVLVNGSEVLTKANTAFTRNYSSGTKIGTIKIGGVSTDIYVPTSSGGGSGTNYWSFDGDLLTPSVTPERFKITGVGAEISSFDGGITISSDEIYLEGNVYDTHGNSFLTEDNYTSYVYSKSAINSMLSGLGGASGEYINLADINGTTTLLPSGTNVLNCTSATSLDFSQITPADTDKPCVLYIVKRTSFTLTIPYNKGIYTVNASTGAMATSQTTLLQMSEGVLVWNPAMGAWRLFIN